MSQITIGVAGASGFVGRYLIESLLEKGYAVVALSRRDRSHEDKENLKWVTCDLFSRKDARLGLEGCDIAFYLTHSMIPSAKLSQGNFADYDLVLADNFARSARINNLKQIIYLGGIVPEDYSLSRHLLSRLEVERTLKASKVPLTSLRAGLILGPEGSSFRIMYNLVNKLPIMVCPSWTATLSNPVSIWDMTKYLLYCIGNHDVYHKHFDVGGTTTLSYIEMMRLLSAKLAKKRLLLVVPFFSPNLSRLWVCKFSGAPKDLVYPLIGSLKTHMVPNINLSLGKVSESSMSYEESIDRIMQESGNLSTIPRAFQYSGAVNDKSVRSIQRLETLYRFNAREVSELYFTWLHSNFPMIAIRHEKDRVNICLSGMSKPLISLEKNLEVSSDDYCLFYIKEGFLSLGLGRGRLIFRTIIDGRNTMVEIHEFVPRLPWYVYKFSQAIFHLVTMKMFNRYLLKLQKNIEGHEKKVLPSC